jgi:hypothetical protein
LRHVKAVVGLEPDAVVIDEANDGNRHAKESGRNGRDPVKRAVGRCVKDFVSLHRGKAAGLTFRGQFTRL